MLDLTCHGGSGMVLQWILEVILGAGGTVSPLPIPNLNGGAVSSVALTALAVGAVSPVAVPALELLLTSTSYSEMIESAHQQFHLTMLSLSIIFDVVHQVGPKLQ